MSKQIKKEELETLQNDQKVFSAIKHDLGALVLQALDLVEGFKTVREKNNKTILEIREEYGPVNINLETGEYEEIKNEEVKEEQNEVVDSDEEFKPLVDEYIR